MPTYGSESTKKKTCSAIQRKRGPLTVFALKGQLGKLSAAKFVSLESYSSNLEKGHSPKKVGEHCDNPPS